ncbi:hypothetical protein [Variovorax sp. dw_308]|uniref:hypothetical protein n=1 Tax=Variovorax sp. dw_308 TaxID=2721546 RepID=UPI001C4413AA|nr:hypothetical protein [Variovorax sp. dw_308]
MKTNVAAARQACGKVLASATAAHGHALRPYKSFTARAQKAKNDGDFGEACRGAACTLRR